MTNTTRDALYALMQRLGANGMTVSSWSDGKALTGAVSAATPWAVMRLPPGRSYVLRPYGEHTEQPAVTWPATRRPTVAEMLIAARAIDTGLRAFPLAAPDPWGAVGKNHRPTLERAEAWARLFAATKARG